MDKHYVCTGGCGGTSDMSGVCQTEGCPKKGQPLTGCRCEDGGHEEAHGRARGEETDEGGEE